jgi:hypothetical protein
VWLALWFHNMKEVVVNQIENNTRITRSEWVSASALGISIIVGIFNIGVVYADQQSMKVDIGKLQIEQREQLRVNTVISERLASIDVNLQILIEDAREKRRGARSE